MLGDSGRFNGPSLGGEIGANFDYNATTSAEMAEWNARLDLTHEICPSTPSEDILIADGGLSFVESRKCEIGPDFPHISATRCAITKWMAPLDSAHQICPSMSLEGVLPAGGAFAAGAV